jgi:hypothetical protein
MWTHSGVLVERAYGETHIYSDNPKELEMFIGPNDTHPSWPAEEEHMLSKGDGLYAASIGYRNYYEKPVIYKAIKIADLGYWEAATPQPREATPETAP